MGQRTRGGVHAARRTAHGALRTGDCAGGGPHAAERIGVVRRPLAHRALYVGDCVRGIAPRAVCARYCAWGSARRYAQGLVRPALAGGVRPPPFFRGRLSLPPKTASVRPPSPSNRFATARTATPTAVQPPATAGAAALGPSPRPPSPLNRSLGP